MSFDKNESPAQKNPPTKLQKIQPIWEDRSFTLQKTRPQKCEEKTKKTGLPQVLLCNFVPGSTRHASVILKNPVVSGRV